MKRKHDITRPHVGNVFARLVDEERHDLLAKRKEGITVEELPPREPETAPPTDSSEDAAEDESHVIDATPTVIAGLSLSPHTTYLEGAVGLSYL